MSEYERQQQVRQSKLENQMWLALNTAREARATNQQKFLTAARTSGAVAAMQLHGKDAARLDLTVRVWEKAMEVGRETGDWRTGLERAYMFATQQLRDSATAKPSSRMTVALSGLRCDAADELLSAIDTVRMTNL